MNEGHTPGWSPLHTLTAIAVLGVSVAWAVYTFQHSWFHTDDLKNFALAFESDWLAYVLTPIDVHFVPLHRLANFVMLRVAPMDFVVGMALLLVLHLASIYYFYRLLQGLFPGRLNLLFVLLYALNANFYIVYAWWSAGLHRFPYLLLTLASMFYFLQFLDRGNRKELLLSTGMFVLALGFYSKAVLIPGYLLCLAIARQVIAPSAHFRAGLVAGAGLLLAAGLYTMWFLTLHESDTDKIAAGYSHLSRAWIVGMQSASQVLMPWMILMLYPPLVLGAWLAALLYTCWRSPKTAILWFLGLGCVGVNIFVIAISSRADSSLTVVSRYNFELVFLQLLFLAMIVHCCIAARGRTGAAAWQPAVAGLSLALYGALATDKALRTISPHAERYLQVAVYARNFHAELDKVDSLAELNLRDQHIPLFLTGAFQPNVMPLSTFIALHQRGIPAYDQADRPLYRVDQEGRLRPVR